jgi:hypothetical protein
MKRCHPRSKFTRFDKTSERTNQVFDKNGAHIKYNSKDSLYKTYEQQYGNFLCDTVKVPIIILQIMATDTQFIVEYVDEADYIIDDNNIVIEDE